MAETTEKQSMGYVKFLANSILALAILAAQTAAAKEAGAYLSQSMSINLPPECYIPIKKYIPDAESFDVNIVVSTEKNAAKILRSRNHNEKIKETGVLVANTTLFGFEHLDGQFNIVKKECAERLYQNVLALRKHEKLEESWQRTGFKYVASSKRPYCGLPIVEATCTYDFPRSSEPLYNIYYDRKESFVAPIFDELKKEGRVYYYDYSFFVPEPGAEKEFQAVDKLIAKSPSNESVNFYFFSPQNGGENQTILLALSPLYVTNTGRSSSGAAEDAKAPGILTKFIDSARRNKSDATKASLSSSQFIFKRAKALLSYWRTRESFFDHLNAVTDTSLDLVYFDFSKGEQTDLESLRKKDELTNVQAVSRAAIEMAANELTHTEKNDKLIEAASLWWAGRALQIQVGCDEEANRPYPGTQQMVADQYEHQTCRRHYTNKAYAHLNMAMAKANKFSLTSPAFLTTYVLGSRKERIRLFGKAFAWFGKNAKKGVLPTKGEMSFLVREVFQTIAEVDEKKVLTWNGTQPADDDDLKEMTDFLADSKDFLEELKKNAKENRWSNAFQYNVVREVWRQIGKRLNLSHWGDEEPLASAVPALKSIFKKSPVIEGFQKELSAIDVSKPDGMRKLSEIMDVALDTIDKAPAFGPEICKAIYDKALMSPNRTTIASNLSFDAKYSNCASTVRTWFSFPAPAEDIDALCKKKNQLACLTQLELDPSKREKLSPAQWALLFTRSSLPHYVLKGFLATTKNKLNSGLADKELSGQWKAAQAEVLIALRAQLRKLLAEESTEQNLEGCFQPDEYKKAYDSPKLPTLSKGCRSVSKQELARKYQRYAGLVRAVLTARLPDPAWKENVLDALENYTFWIQQTEPTSLPTLRKLAGKLSLKAANSARSGITGVAYVAADKKLCVDSGIISSELAKTLYTNSKWFNMDLETRLNHLFDCVTNCEEQPSAKVCSCPVKP